MSDPADAFLFQNLTKPIACFLSLVHHPGLTLTSSLSPEQWSGISNLQGHPSSVLPFANYPPARGIFQNTSPLQDTRSSSSPGIFCHQSDTVLLLLWAHKSPRRGALCGFPTSLSTTYHFEPMQKATLLPASYCFSPVWSYLSLFHSG